MTFPCRSTWSAIGLVLFCCVGLAGTAADDAQQARLAPDFTATTLDGKTLRLGDHRGKVVLLDFWGAWCPPCRAAAPDLVAVHERHASEPFLMIGVSSDPASNAGLLREFVFTNRMKWPQVHDSNEDIAQRYAVNAYPTYIVIDGEGVQRARFDGRGSLKDVEISARQWLKALVTENAGKEKRPAPPAVATPPARTLRQEPSPLSAALSALLNRAAKNLEDYEKQISLVVAEETYLQTSEANSSSGIQTRTLKSDILVIDLGVSGWIGFRDVFEVDGQPVRDHQNRLLALVTSPSPDPLTQARRMAGEGARFNLGEVSRTINMPTTALKFLRSINLQRSSWKTGTRKTIDGRETVELAFTEKAVPRLIETKDVAAAQGRFWIEESTGRIVRTELGIDTAGVKAKVIVTFGPAGNLTQWVPLRLDEEYRPINDRSSNYGPSGAGTDVVTPPAGWGPGSRIDGHATYGKFRTFSVTSNTVLKTPK